MTVPTQRGHLSSQIGWAKLGSNPDAEIVLLRGLGRWSEHWCGFADALAACASVSLIDHRGFGMSKEAHLSVTVSIEQLADDTASAIKAIHKSPVNLVGVSLGGMVAVALAKKHPELVSKLILVNTSVAGSPYPRITPTALWTLALGLWKRGDHFYEALAKVLLGPDANQKERIRLASEWSKIDAKHGLKPALVLKQLLAAARFRAKSQLQNLDLPTLVVKSAKDQFVDSRNSDWIADKIPGAKIVTHPSGGHELGFDGRDWLIQQIIKFVI